MTKRGHAARRAHHYSTRQTEIRKSKGIFKDWVKEFQIGFEQSSDRKDGNLGNGFTPDEPGLNPWEKK